MPPWGLAPIMDIPIVAFTECGLSFHSRNWKAKETLIKCCLSTATIDKVIWHELFQSAEDTGDDDGIRAVHEEDATGDVSGRDGAGGAMGQVVLVGRAALSEAGQWKTAERVGTDAADLFSAAVVQPVGPGGGRSVVRFRPRCGSLRGLTWDRGRCRTRPRCASSVICWKRTIWEKRFWGR